MFAGERKRRERCPVTCMQANNAARAANSKPPDRALYMHLTRTPHMQYTAPCATKAPGTDKAARHPPHTRPLTSDACRWFQLAQRLLFHAWQGSLQCECSWMLALSLQLPLGPVSILIRSPLSVCRFGIQYYSSFLYFQFFKIQKVFSFVHCSLPAHGGHKLPTYFSTFTSFSYSLLSLLSFTLSCMDTFRSASCTCLSATSFCSSMRPETLTAR